MKKLLGILVLGLLLSGCASGTHYETIGGKQIQIGTSSTEVEMWQKYKALNSTYKVYGRIYKWEGIFSFGTKYSNSNYSFEEALQVFFETDSCNKGCWITHVGLEKISEKEQKEYAEKYLPPGIVEQIFGSTKKVEKKSTTKKKESKKTTDGPTSGTAFFISDKGHIITNFHVVETCNNNSKIFYKNNEVDAKLIAKDAYLDLALLKAEINNNKFITISNMAPKKLQRIIAAGYPFGKYLSDDMKFTSGIVSSLKGIQDDSTRLQIDAALNPGNSGGPIVDENTGKLVAVAVAGLRKDMTEAVNFGIKAGSVKNFLESNQINISTFSKSYSRGEIAGLLEKTVLYTFCN